jgi:hypothetical protein
MTDVKFDGYHLPTLVKLCREFDSPTNGPLAELVWRLSNSPALPITFAAEFMRSSGYMPFKGYPSLRRDRGNRR